MLPSTTEVVYLSLQGGVLNYLRSDGTPLGPNLPPHKFPIPNAVGLPEVQTHVGYRWHRVPKTAWGPNSSSALYNRVKGNVGLGIKPLVGTVNLTRFLGRDPGTLLFLGVDEDIVPDATAPDDGWCWNLTFRFLEKTQGHNNLYYGGTYLTASGVKGYYFAATGDTWYAAGSVPDGICLFNEAEHATLFEVG